MSHTFKTFADAELAGFVKVNPKATDVKDVSGPNSFGYQFQRGQEKSVMIYATQERNRAGGLGAHSAYWPPKS